MTKLSVFLSVTMLTTTSLFAQSSDILVYKFARTRTWQQFEAKKDGLPVTPALKGRNVLSGVTKDNSYWVIDRATNAMVEVRYYTAYVDDVKQKLYDISPWTYTDLNIDPAAYSLDASGDGDQFMEIMTMPSSKAGVLNQSFRSCTDLFAGLDYGFFTWHLSGPTTATIALSKTASVSNVAKTLTGLFRSGLNDKRLDSNDILTSIVVRADAGAQSATFDAALTLKVRTLAAAPSLTPNTLDNGIQFVSNTLENLGYDIYLPPVY